MADRTPHGLTIFFAAAIGLMAGALRPPTPVASGLADTSAVTVIPPRSLFKIIKDVIDRVGADNLTLVAAGVAFYGFLALFPAVAATVAVFGLVADPFIVEHQLVDLAGFLPKSAIDLLVSAVHAVAEKPPGQLGVTFAVSVAIALWSARAGITSLMTGLDIAYRVRELRSFVMSTIIGLALTLGGVVVAAILVATIAVLPAIYAAAPGYFTQVIGDKTAWARWPILVFEMAVSLAIIYRIGPSKPLPGWRLFSIGTLVATVLWLLSSCAFSLYVGSFGSYDATYGSLAGAVVMMLWLWASSLSVLVGATVDAVLEGKPA